MIRVYALARELNIDSKLLLAYCQRAGIPAKNRLAKLTSGERERVINFLSEHPELPRWDVSGQQWPDYLPPKRNPHGLPGLCRQTHATYIVGRCPWCSSIITWGRARNR